MSDWLGNDGLYSVAVLQCGSPIQQGIQRDVLAGQQLPVQVTTSNWEGILPIETPEPRGPAQGSGPGFAADERPEVRPVPPNFAAAEEEQIFPNDQVGISGGPPGGPIGPGRVRPVAADAGAGEVEARPAPTRPQQPFATAVAPRLLTVKKGLLFAIGLSSFAAFI